MIHRPTDQQYAEWRETYTNVPERIPKQHREAILKHPMTLLLNEIDALRAEIQGIQTEEN